MGGHASPTRRDHADSEWLSKLRLIAAGHEPHDMLMMGDFGKDQDDEKALAMAVALRHLGLVGRLSVIANLGNAQRRAQLAKGTLLALGATDVPVAAGTDGGNADDATARYEFDYCTYLAPESELHSGSGHELFFAAMEAARARGRKISIVLNSSLTDMRAVIQDSRWPAVRGLVACVAAMGGLKRQEDGVLLLDDSAQNPAFDKVAAEEVYTALMQDPDITFIVATRHAAGTCQMAPSAFDGSLHPVALRLRGAAKPALQELWRRTHLTQEQRDREHDKLPARCNPAWFQKTFLEESAPADLRPGDDVWPYVRGFAEYDGLTTIAAVAVSYPALMDEFFAPVICPRTGVIAIGLSPTEHGIQDPQRASSFMHDLLQIALGGGLDCEGPADENTKEQQGSGDEKATSGSAVESSSA